MAQKSIRSFFTAKSTNKTEDSGSPKKSTTDIKVQEDVPAKAKTKRRRNVIDSDSDDDIEKENTAKIETNESEVEPIPTITISSPAGVPSRSTALRPRKRKLLAAGEEKNTSCTAKGIKVEKKEDTRTDTTAESQEDEQEKAEPIKDSEESMETETSASVKEEEHLQTDTTDVDGKPANDTTSEKCPEKSSSETTPSIETKPNAEIKKSEKKSIKSKKESKKSPKASTKSKNKKTEEKPSPKLTASKSPKKEACSESSSETKPEEKKESPAQKPVEKEVDKPEEKKESPAQKPVEKEVDKPAAQSGWNQNKDKSKSDDDYNPGKSKYHVVEDAVWKKNEKVPYLAIAKTFSLIEEITSRLRIVEILSNLFRSIIVLSPDELLPAVYLCTNKIAPAYEGLELGIGEGVLIRALADATGKSPNSIKDSVKKLGDLGLVAENCRGNQKLMFAPAKLTVQGVFAKLKELAKMSGHSVMSKKCSLIRGMLVACREYEARYVIRSLSGKLRIGLAEQSVLAALGQAVTLTPPGSESPSLIAGKFTDSLKETCQQNALVIKTTYCECPNYDKIIKVLLEPDGLTQLPIKCKLIPGIPLKPMLAHPTSSISQVLTRFDGAEFVCEYKYDGERAQIHLLENGDVHIYSRNSEDNTSKYPDIISRMPKVKNDDVKSYVLDSEAVAWDPEKQQIQPFQILSTRKRKDANKADIKVQVCVYAFDLLYLNGESLVREPFRRRRELLHASFTESSGEFVFAQSRVTSDTERIQDFLDDSIKDSCEGLMVKTLDRDATYEIAKRSHNWLKVKKDYLDGMGDTLDLVVIGGYNGSGKRTGKYGGFLLACYDTANEEFQTICKIGTGFSDANLEKHTTFFKEHVIEQPKSYFRYDSSHEPDDWFEPVQVWEVRAADLSISPVHQAAAGLADPERGISLRFPRFVRIREDKTPEQATNSEQVAEMYHSQQQIQNQANSADLELDDEI